MPEHWCALIGKSRRERRASLTEARALYRRRFGRAPGTGRVFRVGRAVCVAYALP